LAKKLGEVLRTPFAASSQNETRQETLVQLANSAHDLPMLVDALGQYEPYSPWNADSLAARVNAYKAAGHQLQGKASMELFEFRTAQGETVLDDVIAASAAPTDSNKGTAMIEK
jgi:hypothetical protein